MYRWEENSIGKNLVDTLNDTFGILGDSLRSRIYGLMMYTCQIAYESANGKPIARKKRDAKFRQYITETSIALEANAVLSDQFKELITNTLMALYTEKANMIDNQKKERT
jgi:hypothetical protein